MFVPHEFCKSSHVGVGRAKWDFMSNASRSEKEIQEPRYLKCLVNVMKTSQSLIFFVSSNRFYYLSSLYLHNSTDSFGVFPTSASTMLQCKRRNSLRQKKPVEGINPY